MRYILILLLTTTILFSKSQDSCYSVQLKSFVFKQNSNYNFDEEGYPDSCQLISFANMNTVRCGCYDRYNEAKKETKDLVNSYPEAMVVTTYRYRFKRTEKVKETKNIEIVKPITIMADSSSNIKKTYTEKKSDIALENVIEGEVEPTNDDLGFIDELVLQGSVDLTAQYYKQAPKNKNSNNITASSTLDMQYNKNDFKFKAKVKAQQDYYDLHNDAKTTNRSFIRIDELYSQYDFENSQIMLGKNIRFWGALEVRNITDNFNSDELRADPFYKDKLGSWNTSYSYYTDSGELSIIVKLYEQEREISKFPYVYYYFPATVTGSIPLQYSNKLLTEDGQDRPSVYLKYSGSTDTEYPLDYAVILENGYDSQRYYTRSLNIASNTITTNENAYLVNKLNTYNTLVVNSTLYKLEAVYADVIKNTYISDYFHLGLGIEHTIPQVFEEADLGLILEYYRYKTFENSKRNDLELFELFQNDVFIGGRYTLNDGKDSNIVSGAILDMDYDEQVYYFEYETRLADILKINFDYRYIKPSKNYDTAFHLMGTHERVSLKIGYHF